jgi:TM2 domain-containing membrane protein YozV
LAADGLGLPEGFNTTESTGFLLKENKRLVAALLTLSLGMLGVHRLYLGSKPWIPLVYLLTFGGGFFILPLIDLIAILTAPDIDKYLNNPRVFMWIEPNDKTLEK